jgi:outer membrane protein assembly factor BamB
VPAPVVAGELALFTSNHRPIRDEDRGQPIYAVRFTARGDISIPKESDAGEFVAWAQSGRGNYMQTPLVYRDLAYFCKDNGVAICFDLATGERKWQERIGDGSTGFTASPVAADGKVYWTSEEGNVHVIAAGPEHKELAKNSLGEICMATPAISDGVLYFRTRSHVVAIGAP